MNVMNMVRWESIRKIKSEAIIKDNYTPAFMLKHMVKDIVSPVRKAGTPNGRTCLPILSAGTGQYAEEDLIAIRKYLQH